MKPEPRTGVRRVLAAFRLSLSGLREVLDKAAFRQELSAAAAGLLLAILPLPPVWKALLLLTLSLVLITELLDSTNESVANLAAPEFEPLQAGQGSGRRGDVTLPTGSGITLAQRIIHPCGPPVGLQKWSGISLAATRPLGQAFRGPTTPPCLYIH